MIQDTPTDETTRIRKYTVYVTGSYSPEVTTITGYYFYGRCDYEATLSPVLSPFVGANSSPIKFYAIYNTVLAFPLELFTAGIGGACGEDFIQTITVDQKCKFFTHIN